MNAYNQLTRKVRIRGTLAFDTAFHIGSGRESELASDMGVLLDWDGRPILPGSTLKGSLRACAERLAPHLGMTACLLDTTLSGISCVSDETYRRSVSDELKALDTKPDRKGSEADRIDWLQEKTCDVCRLFGSPMQASRIFLADGELGEWSHSLQVRDGVCIDRDSETARSGLKFDYEVVPAGAAFGVSLEMENPSDREIALIGAALAEWENGFHLGGFTSRGLGSVRLTEKSVQSLDYTDPAQLKAYLLEGTLQQNEGLLTESLERALNAPQGESHA